MNAIRPCRNRSRQGRIVGNGTVSADDAEHCRREEDEIAGGCQPREAVEHSPIVDDAVEAHSRRLDARLVQPAAHRFALVAQNVVFGHCDQCRRQAEQFFPRSINRRQENFFAPGRRSYIGRTSISSTAP